MKEKLLIIFGMAIFNALFLNAFEDVISDNQIIIYGKVTTVDDEVYTGQIRWGDEEAYWFDMFNSSKPKNENLKYLSDDELDELNEKDHEKHGSLWKGWNKSYNYGDDHEHIFACRFGDIKSLEMHGKEKVTLTLKNGETIKMKGGSNDIGAKIQVNDGDLGMIKLKWKRVARVDFMQAPGGTKNYFGHPLYGTVETSDGNFTGYVQWDHDERLSKDVLNGDSDDGEMDIEFGNIKSIKNVWSGSEVTLNSGRVLKLDGSNDVDSDNRGIIVNNPDFGRVDISWDEFKKVTFEDYNNQPALSYNDFKGEKKLKGTVVTKDGESHRGELVYDLDEKYQLEILDGIQEDIAYLIPFGLVETVTPLNREEARVTLKNKKKYVFEDKVDVNRDNDGVLIFKSERDYVYVPWSEIDQVRFDN